MIVYDTGTCPRCGSKWTGRIIKKASDAKDFALMGPVIYTSIPDERNCGCVNCDVRWTAPRKLKWVPFKQYIALRKEWFMTVDSTSSLTPIEEEDLAREMYQDLTGEDLPKRREHFKLLKKIIKSEKKSLGKQLGAATQDLTGFLGIYPDDGQEDEGVFTGYDDTELGSDYNMRCGKAHKLF